MLDIFTKKGKSALTLEEVTELLQHLRIPLSLVFTPTNLKEEKKKFFNSDTYEPIFEYKIVKNKNDEIFKELSNVKLISDVDPRISDFYIQLIESKKLASDLMHSVGNNDLVTELSFKKYRAPSATLFRNSARVLRGKLDNYDVRINKKVDRGEKLNYEQIEKVFNVAFEMLGLEGWSVATSKNISKNGIKVGIKRKQILVDSNITRSEFKIKKTLIHEVGTHVLRSINGFETGFPALGNANLTSYLDIEEGLATWNEESMGYLTDKWLKKKAGMVWAIYLGENLSFRELYNALSGNFLKYSSWDIVYRVKRGLGDTSYPGIYGKDIVYFRGFRKVKRILEKDPTMYEKFYAGKIDYKRTRWVDEGLLPKPKIVPTKEMWKEIFKKAGV
ncbi:MAG: seg [candidate division WS6 bacterium 34_10]|uniref:Seg n=1 Tax=candidate division WS6 bacterium 34_10 TaxID=1641389 RepID=A0A101HIL4_9BACT|nr:MAG: seg [candidate division WS6 bacterium 34_10]